MKATGNPNIAHFDTPSITSVVMNNKRTLYKILSFGQREGKSIWISICKCFQCKTRTDLINVMLQVDMAGHYPNQGWEFIVRILCGYSNQIFDCILIEPVCYNQTMME